MSYYSQVRRVVVDTGTQTLSFLSALATPWVPWGTLTISPDCPPVPMGPASGSCSDTVRRREARQERGEGRVDSPWGPWIPGQCRHCCVLAPRAAIFQVLVWLREGDQSVAPASSDVSLCPVATACPTS